MAVVEAGLHLSPRGDVPDKAHLETKIMETNYGAAGKRSHNRNVCATCCYKLYSVIAQSSNTAIQKKYMPVTSSSVFKQKLWTSCRFWALEFHIQLQSLKHPWQSASSYTATECTEYLSMHVFGVDESQKLPFKEKKFKVECESKNKR